MHGKRNPPIGARPGTLAIPEDARPPQITVVSYSAAALTTRVIEDPRDLADVAGDDHVIWVDVQGLGDGDVLRQIAAAFNIHPLALADVVNVPQRPKLEIYDDQIFFVGRMILLDGAFTAKVEQLSVFLGHRYVVTFQERADDGDVLDPVRQRLSQNVGLIRAAGADYLAYAIIDTTIDSYFPVLEIVTERLEVLESSVLDGDADDVLAQLSRGRAVLMELRRALWPEREAIGALLREPSELVSDGVRPYIRDTLDHCVQCVDVVEIGRELAASILGTHVSVVSNRTNEIMKVLTLMSAIFIPLTFIAGVYGMNFLDMPELSLWWAYPMVLAVMLIIAMSMVAFFYHRGWLGRTRRRRTGRKRQSG